MAMLAQASDYRDECAALHELLLIFAEQEWSTPTLFKRWTANDVIGHLHIFDFAAGLTLDSDTSLRQFFARMREGRSDRWTLLDYTRQWLGGCSGQALRVRWFEFSLKLAARYELEDPARRVAWGGPDMSVRSCITARQMETWAHGQALYDLMGMERREQDRLRNIATLGVNTRGWSFANRGLPVPAIRPCVDLVAPSGSRWCWNEGTTSDRVEGSAVDFCRVVTQTRNVADTTLRVTGEVARQWMSIAQCFAGPPHAPPPPGTRYRQSRGADRR